MGRRADRTVSRRSVIEQIRRANAPPPPDHSVLFRVATGAAVLTGIFACGSVGELSTPVTVISGAAVAIGMVFSYTTRIHPWQWLKVLLAVAVVTVFGFFVNEILSAAHTGELSSIEVPLAGLFAWVQAIHAFDVPARRDLLFSIAAAGALVTIAGAQAVSGDFVGFVAVWLLATLVALACSWRSMTGGTGPIGFPALAASLLVVLAISLSLLVVLPQPRASANLTLPASITSDLPLSGTGIVNGSGSEPEEPAQPGKPGGKIGVGGFVGFDGPLQTADRGALGNEVVMRVRADRPGYFLGMTYDTWNGESWLQSRADRGATVVTGGSPFAVPTRALTGDHISTNIQTFYVEQPLANLLFSTEQPTEVYFPASSLIEGADGSLRSTVALTPGTVYTVVSADDQVSPEQLAAESGPLSPSTLALPQIQRALQLPHAYPRVARLTQSIVARAHASTTVAKVQALEAWMASHTHYTTDIPPLRPGQDTVDQFLFGSRKGYCEQISTSLAVMLRTIGIPAREAIGYVPGPFDPLSDMYEILASDAHAWVQVYFPRYGWQNFDPTAQVPLAAANPGSVLLHDALRQLARLPWAPIGGTAAVGATACGAVAYERRRRRRPATRVGLLAARLERLGSRAHLPRHSSETLQEYGRRLDEAYPALGVARVVSVLDDFEYSSAPPSGQRAEAALAQVEEMLDGLAASISRRAALQRRLGAAIRPARHASA